MDDEKIFFKFIIDIPDIDKAEPGSQSSAGEHIGELVLGNESEIFIKIFYDPRENLDRKIMGREADYSFKLLSKFRVVSVESQYKNILHIDFSDYEFSGMTSGTSDESGHVYFTIGLTGIKLIYRAAEEQDSEIYLNGTAFWLIERNYKYHPNFSWRNDSFKWEPKNKVTDPIDFNNIQFIPEHRFYTITRDKDVSIIKEPRIRIKHKGLSEEEVKAHANLLCDLFSFYSNKEIAWRRSRIYAAGKLFYEVKRVQDEENKYAGIFSFDFFQNPLNLIRNVDPVFLFENRERVSKMIERFNYALRLRDETKFMILYGVLEQLRNQYIEAKLIEIEANGNPNRAKEEYSFVRKPKEINEAIENAITSLSDLVAPEQRELFRKEAKYKVFGIRVLSMVNQFQSYFDYLKINPEEYDINFLELKSLRDKIFHGRNTDELQSTLRKANWYNHLPRFTGVLMLKFFGIEDLRKIENKPYHRASLDNTNNHEEDIS